MKLYTLVFLFLTIEFYSCDYKIVKSISNLHSNSIANSKENGMFIKSYKPVSYRLNDSIYFNIEEAFAEYKFSETSYTDHSLIKRGGYQVVLKMKPNDNLKRIEETWMIKGFSTKGLPILTSDCIYDSIVPPDTLNLKIMNGSLEKLIIKEDEGTEIGNFYLYRNIKTK